MSAVSPDCEMTRVQAGRVEGRLAVARLGGDVDLHGQARQGFEPVFRHQPGIIGGAAGGDREPREVLEIERQRLGQGDPAIGEVDVMGQRAAHHLGLLVDFLGHEVAVVAFLDPVGLGDDALALARDRVAVDVADRGALAGQHRPVALLQIGDLLGEGGEREGVRAQIGLALAEADGQGRTVAGADEEIVVAGEDEAEGEGTAQARQGGGHGLHRAQALVHLGADELGHDLRVGLALEAHAAGLQLGLQLAEILDDAVMDDGQPRRGMGVGIGLVRPAMGGPAGMADADGAGQRLVAQPEFEVGELALGAAAIQPAIGQGGDAGRIVAAIFEAAQGFDHLSRHRLMPDDANDSTHGRYFSYEWAWPGSGRLVPPVVPDRDRGGGHARRGPHLPEPPCIGSGRLAASHPVTVPLGRHGLSSFSPSRM